MQVLKLNIEIAFSLLMWEEGIATKPQVYLQ